MVKVIFNNINEQVKEFFKSNQNLYDKSQPLSFKASNLRNYISEEYFRCNLFSKLVSCFENTIPEKVYTKQFKYHFNNEKCDLFFKDSKKKNNWIELKFFIPTNYGTVGNFGKVIRDFIRLLYFTEDEDTELYFIMFILCGKYKTYSIKKEKGLKNYFSLKNKPATSELFFSNTNSFDFRLKDSLKENNNANFKRGLTTKYQHLPLLYDTVGIKRTIFSDLVNNNLINQNLSFKDYDKNLICYIFKLERRAKNQGKFQKILQAFS